jgi:hypothetical protein
MAKQPVLDLNTLIERPTINIRSASGEKTYEILSPDELSLLDCQWFEAQGNALDELSKDKGRQEELAELIDTLVRKVFVDLPDDVAKELSDIQRMQVIEVFIMLLLRRRAEAVGATTNLGTTRSQSTGASNSPGSSGSSAEIRTGGSAEPRPSLSGRT